MITNIGRKILKLNGFGSLLPAVAYTSNNYGFSTAKDKDGNDIIITPNVAYSENDLRAGYYNTGQNARAGYIIGSDDTPASESDYTLGNIITTFTAVKSTNTVYDSVNNEYSSYIEWTVTNTGNEAITIKEIGRYLIMNTASAIGQSALANTQNKHVLIDRTVLDYPITIEPNASAILRYEAKYL